MDAGAGECQRVTRRHLGAYLDEFVFRSNRRHNLVVAFGTLLDLGAMREPTTNDTITGAKDIPGIFCTLSEKQTGRRQRRNKLRPLAPTRGTSPEATGQAHHVDRAHRDTGPG